MSGKEEEYFKLKKRNALIESDYNDMKGEFFKISSVISDLADVLDVEFKEYTIEEDKSHKFMILSKQKVEELQRSPSKVHEQLNPFTDDLQRAFYKILPDYSKIIVSAEEAQEIMRVEKMDNQELIDEEVK